MEQVPPSIKAIIDQAAQQAPPKSRSPLQELVWLLGGTINKDSIMLTSIIVLILTVIGLTIGIIATATNPGVNVTFTTVGQDSQSPSQSQVQNQDDEVASQDQSDTLVTADLEIMMVATVINNQQATLPASAIPLGTGGVDAFLVPVRIKTETRRGEELQTALGLLFGQQAVIYNGLSLTTTLNESDISVSVTSDFGQVIVDLSGSLVVDGVLSLPIVRAQIEETVKLYTSNFVIKLNGSEGDYSEFWLSNGV